MWAGGINAGPRLPKTPGSHRQTCIAMELPLEMQKEKRFIINCMETSQYGPRSYALQSVLATGQLRFLFCVFDLATRSTRMCCRFSSARTSIIVFHFSPPTVSTTKISNPFNCATMRDLSQVLPITLTQTISNWKKHDLLTNIDIDLTICQNYHRVDLLFIGHNVIRIFGLILFTWKNHQIMIYLQFGYALLTEGRPTVTILFWISEITREQHALNGCRGEHAKRDPVTVLTAVFGWFEAFFTFYSFCFGWILIIFIALRKCGS